MAAYRLLVVSALVLLSLLAQQATARQIRQVTKPGTLKTQADLSLEELLYILKSRNGEVIAKPKRITPCARAILGCCKDKQINENCSESLQCGGLFFDANPCEDRFIIDALQNARHFYEQFEDKKESKSY